MWHPISVHVRPAETSVDDLQALLFRTRSIRQELALSGSAAAIGHGPRARLAGFDRFLLKPAPPDDLQRLLDGVAAQRAAS